jgi:hypothetical protein
LGSQLPHHVTVITFCAPSSVLGVTNDFRDAALSLRVIREGAMSRNKLWVMGIFAAAMVSGCAATSPGVAPVGDDAYRLSVMGARYETQADVNYKALLAANDYCDKANRHMMFRQSTESSEHSWSPKQEDLTFVCMDENDPAYMRPSVEHIPQVVAKE